MSLLNDALRKKKNEQQQGGGAPVAAMPGSGSKGGKIKRRQFWVIGGFAVLVAAVIWGAWFYRSATGSPTFLVQTGQAPVHTTPSEHDPSPEPESQEVPAVSTAAVSTAALSAVPDAAPPEPASPAPATKPEIPAKTLKPTPPKQKPPLKKQAARRPVKPAIAAARKPKMAKGSGSSQAPVARPIRINKQRRLQADRLYKKACQYHRQNSLEQAIAMYQEVIKINPEHPEARFNLGAAYLQTEAFSKAYYIMADLYLREPDNQQVMLNLAIADFGLHRFEDALALLDKAAATPEPPLFEIALHKGIVFNHLKKPQQAMDWYKRAEALRPDDPRLLFNLAVVLDQQQHYSEAIHYYERHMEQSPEMDTAREKQIRRRIRVLQAFQTQSIPREAMPQ